MELPYRSVRLQFSSLRWVSGVGFAVPDLLYAALAVIGGAALAGLVQSVDQPLRYTSAAVLVAIAVVGLRRVGRSQESVQIAFPDRRELASTYARLLGLTIINPTTIVYFAAVIVGLGVANGMSAVDGGFFVLGAFVASLSWQTLLAGVGAFAGDRLGRRAQAVAIIAGNLVILVFAVVILVQ